jgi:hypothetical protein
VVSEGGVNIKEPVPLYFLDWEWNVVIFHQSLQKFGALYYTE